MPPGSLIPVESLSSIAGAEYPANGPPRTNFVTTPLHSARARDIKIEPSRAIVASRMF
jgi:hypothetical protein